jgi:hypothetical protein
VDQGNHAKEKKLLMIAKKFFGYGDIRVGQLLLVDEYGFFTPVSFLQKFALERAGERYFAFGTAANRADVAVHGRTAPPGAPLAAYLA